MESQNKPAQLLLDATQDQASSFVDKNSSLKDHVLNERYRIEEELGRGGMAIVYRAKEIQSGRVVAVKMMRARLTGTAKQRFTREFSTIASITHPHCLDVYEYGESTDGPFFAMELFSGQPISSLIGQPTELILKAIYDVAEALDYVHSRRIIHRDIKPANILARRKPDGSGFSVKLADFGLAKFANTSSSMSGDSDFLGTVAYCAPEQIMQGDLDYRADLYSFGLVCYELISGQYPFQDCRRNIQALIAAHLKRQPKPILELSPQVPTEVAAVVMQMLSKDAGGRPLSTTPLRTAIANHVGLSIDVTAEAALKTAPQQFAADFVAREKEVKQVELLLSKSLNPLSEEIASASKDPVGSILFITGEAGIGKSSLLRQAARAAIIEGARLYEGRSFEGNLSPFQPFVSIVKQVLAGQSTTSASSSSGPASDLLAPTTFLQASDDTERIVDVVERFSPELLRMGPDLRNLIAGEVLQRTELVDNADYVYRALASFFVELSKIQTTCLLFEDLHWADESTLNLLRHLSSALREARLNPSQDSTPPRLMLCATSRVGSDYQDTERFIESIPNAVSVNLEVFDDAAATELICSLIGCERNELDDSLIAKTNRYCLGSPFYITQVVKEWQLQQRLVNSNGKWSLSESMDDSTTSLPDSVHEALRKQIQTLDKLSSQVVFVAAVIGAKVDVNLLRQVLSKIDEFEFHDALDDLLARHIIRETNVARQVQFTHDLLREITLDLLTPTRRESLHGQIAKLLESKLQSSGKGDAAIIGDHFLAAGEKQKALGYLLQAGEATVQSFSYPAAISLLRKAEPLTSSADNATIFRLQFNLGSALAATGDHEGAVSCFERSVDVAPGSTDRADAYFGKGKAYLILGRFAEAREFFELALSQLGEKLPQSWTWLILTGFPSFLWLHFAPTWIRWPGGHNEERLRKKSLAIRVYIQFYLVVVMFDLKAGLHSLLRMGVIGKQSGTDKAKLIGYSRIAYGLGKYGYSNIARPYLKVAETLAEKSEGEMEIALSGIDRAFCMYQSGDLIAAEQLVLEHMPTLEKSQSWFYGWANHVLTHIYINLGDVEATIATANAEKTFGELVGDPFLTAWGTYSLADTMARKGELDEAIRHAEKAIELLEGAGGGITVPIAYMDLGRVKLQMSDYGGAKKALAKGIEWHKSNYILMEFSAGQYPHYVEAILGPNWHAPERMDRDEINGSKIAGRIARKMCRRFPTWKSLMHRVAGRQAAAHANPVQARQQFDMAISCSEIIGARYDLARALIDKSMLDYPSANDDCKRGLNLLGELGCVLPEAEQEYLGIPMKVEGEGQAS